MRHKLGKNMSEELEPVTPPQEGQEDEPEEIVDELVEEPEEDVDALKLSLQKETEARRQLTARAKQAEADKKVLEAKLRASKKPTLDVDDYIDISASLEGLDQKEKAYIAEQHKYTGKSLKDIRNDENFLLWQNAYRQKVEKEKTLAPSSKQSEGDRPRSLLDKLKGASFEEREKLMTERGLYKQVRPRADRTPIGRI